MSYDMVIPPGSIPLTRAATDVLTERARQVTAEGWSPTHDDSHSLGELGRAAIQYAVAANYCTQLGASSMHSDEAPPLQSVGLRVDWPWARRFWKPGPARRMLVKAAALLIAEIERLDRAAEPAESNADRERRAMAERLDAITMREAFAGARQLSAKKFQPMANWVFAMELYALGSTYAWAICERMGIDPDAKTVTRRPEVSR